MRSMTIPMRLTTIVAVAAIAALQAEGVEARGFGIGFGGFFIGIGHGGYRGHRHHHGGGGGDEERDADKGEKPGKRGKGNALLARAGDALFKSIVVSKGLGSVGVEEEIDPSKINQGRDNKRDYTAALADLLKMIDATTKRTSREGASFLAQGDVTQHALDRAVSQAYESSNLAAFEQFVGEQWTNERLRVAIIDRARSEVPGLLVGNNLGRVEIAPLEDSVVGACLYVPGPRFRA